MCPAMLHLRKSHRMDEKAPMAKAPSVVLGEIPPVHRMDNIRADVLLLDRAAVEHAGRHDALESAIANAETAYRMQAAVPELMDLAGESAATKALYGLDAPFEPT